MDTRSITREGGVVTHPSDKHPYHVRFARRSAEERERVPHSFQFSLLEELWDWGDVRACITDDDGTYLVPLTAPHPADMVSTFPIVRDGTVRNVLADLQQYPDPGGSPRVIAFFIRV